MIDLENLIDRDRALLYLYVKEKGIPPWAKGDAEIMAAICGWELDRAETALRACVANTFATKEPATV